MYDFFVGFVILFPYVLIYGMEIYDRTEFAKHRRIKNYSQELIQLFIDVNYEYFSDTIERWCEIHEKKVINNKIL